MANVCFYLEVTILICVLNSWYFSSCNFFYFLPFLTSKAPYSLHIMIVRSQSQVAQNKHVGNHKLRILHINFQAKHKSGGTK